MLQVKNKVKFIICTVVLLMFCLNIKVIASRDKDSELSNTNMSIVNPDNNPYRVYVCVTCTPMPGQNGIEYICVNAYANDCFVLPCGYGMC